MQHARIQRKNSAPARAAHDAATLREQRDATHLHDLGPRVLAALLAELREKIGEPEVVDHIVARYLRLTRPMITTVLGSRQFPPHIFEVQP